MTKKLQTIQIIHLAFCIGIIAAYVIIGNLFSSKAFRIPELDFSFYAALLITVSAFFLSNFLYKSKINHLDKTLKLEERLLSYQTATIMRLASLEAAAFLILILLPSQILLGLVILLYLIILRLSEDQFRRDFENPL